jgi:glycosyltransferase involved in cell wall biosynthesis
MQKVLIIAYYWPPSGGAGVQRWLKLTKYLSRYGVKPYVLTVDEDYASYLQIDESLAKDVSPEVTVHKTRSFEPINYYSRLVGKENVPTAGFSNVNNDRFLQKAINAIRSNLFIPDPRRGWKKYAVRKAKEIIRKEKIDLVITTSPPHSTQLIGLQLKKDLGMKWIVDLRDPWTDIYYYNILGHSFLSRYLDRSLERKVLQNADSIITVSHGFKDIFSGKIADGDEKIEVVPNGFDQQDFQNLAKQPHETFTICYTGTISDQYNLSGLIEAIKQLQSSPAAGTIKLQIVGQVSTAIREAIMANEVDLEVVKTVPHDQVNQFQKNADLLLLIIPDVQNALGIIPGKIFEYLASHNHILCLGPTQSDAAKIIERCAMGATFESEDAEGIAQYLQQQLDRFATSTENPVNTAEIAKFTREVQARDICEIIRRTSG